MGQVRLFAIEVSSGAVKPLTGEGHVAAADAGSKAIVYAQNSIASPDQLYSIAQTGGTPTLLTHHDSEQLTGVGFSTLIVTSPSTSAREVTTSK